MIIKYADDMSKWKKWMKEYKYGVILIFPPDPHNSKITELRNEYNWSYTGECEAHISLSVQIPKPVTKGHLDEIQTKLKQVKPFKINYGPIVENPSHPGVVLNIRPQEKLRHLVKLIESTSLFNDAIERSHPFYGHMTIAEMETTIQGSTFKADRMEQTLEIIKEVKDNNLSGEFTVEYLSYAVPNENFRFTERERIYLGYNK